MDVLYMDLFENVNCKVKTTLLMKNFSENLKAVNLA